MIRVAIDGPAGVGKSSTSKALAKYFGYAYLDTGAMYRACAWWCLKQDIDLDAETVDERVITEAVGEFFTGDHFDISVDPDNPRVFADDEDISEAIRSSEVSSHVSKVSNVIPVRNVLIAAQRANIEMPFEKASAIDLAGRDVLQAVQMSVTPKVIETPVVAAIAKDGIELRAKARVTVRANIERLVGGAGEETIIARVGEGIVTTVGSAETHKQVLENPDMISRTVLSKGLDAGTAFEILSIDIADVDVGRNIGAQLMMDQAESDRRVAQAKAEERRAMAVAHEQEMKAAVQEMRAKVVEAEAEVPKAMAAALREGKLGVMDYYQMQNTIADTSMRDSIAKASAPQSTPTHSLEKK